MNLVTKAASSRSKVAFLLFIILQWITHYHSLSCMAKNANDFHRSIDNDNNSKKTLISFPLLHQQHIIARRRLESKKNKNKLEGAPPPWGTIYQGYGTHYVDLWVGTPPQRQTVIIDTGSDITAFPCQECGSKCGKTYHTDDNFIHTNSSSFYKLQCTLSSEEEESGNEWIEFKESDDDAYDTCQVGECSSVRRLNDETICQVGVMYAEGSSWDAYEARDIVYLGGSHDMPLVSKNTDPERRDKDMRILSKTTYKMSDNLRRRNDPQRRLDDTNAKESIIEIQHNTNDLENEFKHEAHMAEEQYFAKHQSHHDGDNNGFAANDYSFTLSFGCQYKITGLFKTQLADGIMGMEYSNDSFWMQMYNANIIQSRMFALCFTLNNEKVSKKGTVAGSMTLGGANPRLHDSKMVYAQNDSADGWYTVYITGVYLRRGKDSHFFSKNDEKNEYDESENDNEGGEKHDEGESQNDGEGDKHDEVIGDTIKLPLNIHQLNSRGVIIDSGTTDSYLPSFVYKHFQSAYEKIYGMTLREIITNHKADEIDIQSFPTILIQLKSAEITSDEDIDMYEGMNMKFSDDNHGKVGLLDPRHSDDVLIEIPPHHYLSVERNRFEERFHLNDEDGSGILGANSMFGYDLLFDMENGRIGFARSECQP